MSILSDFEDRVSRAVEGVFAGVFRSPVQPAELARACAKEMDRRRKLGVGKVYAPNLYSVLLSAEDGEQLGGFADTLAGELATYLTGHARERDYELATRPVVRFLIDDDLRLGRFVVIGELLSAEEVAAELGEDEHAESPEAVHAPARAPEAPVPAASFATSELFDAEAHLDEPGYAGLATITVPGIGHDVVLSGERMVIGRLKACEICLADANASRQHAALEREGAGWVLEDLGSTNGTLVNGVRADRVRLRDGDVITIGVSALEFHEPRG